MLARDIEIGKVYIARKRYAHDTIRLLVQEVQGGWVVGKNLNTGRRVRLPDYCIWHEEGKPYIAVDDSM